MKGGVCVCVCVWWGGGFEHGQPRWFLICTHVQVQHQLGRFIAWSSMGNGYGIPKWTKLHHWNKRHAVFEIHENIVKCRNIMLKMWMRHHGRVIPVAILISSLTSYEGQYDRTMWRYHRLGFFVHNVFAIWGCILSITFVHFVHGTMSNTACLLFQWYNFFHFDNGPTSLCTHTVRSLCTNTGVITCMVYWNEYYAENLQT